MKIKQVIVMRTDLETSALLDYAPAYGLRDHLRDSVQPLR